jgi:predicted amidohydrolase YtcJ
MSTKRSAIKADLVIRNATIHTMDESNPTAEALAIIGDRIIGVGKNFDFDTVIDSDTEVLDLYGKTVLPGLNDNHCHPLTGAQNLANVDITDAKNHKELFETLRKHASKMRKGEWVIAYGYQEHMFDERRVPTLEELDAALPNHPVHITRACNHVGLANSLALNFMNYTSSTPDPEGGLIERKNGKLTGILREAANFNLRNRLPQISVDRLAEAMGEMSKKYNENGITSTTDMGLLNARDDEFAVWAKVLRSGYLSVRTAAYLFEENYHRLTNEEIPIPFGDHLYRFQGRKIIVDGSGGPATAMMSEPSLTYGENGILYYSTQEELDEDVWDAHARGHQIAAHAIGNVAIEMLLNAYKKAQERLPRPDIRHRIEHCSFCFPPLIDRVIKEGVYPSFNTGYFYFFGEAHLANYGQERLNGEFPYRTFLDNGVQVSNATDAPVLSLNPAPTLYGAISRKMKSGKTCGEKERITAYEALVSYTRSGAFLTHDETEKGTLSPGKFADIIVTNIDPTSPGIDAEPERILDLKIEKTILGGETVYTAM